MRRLINTDGGLLASGVLMLLAGSLHLMPHLEGWDLGKTTWWFLVTITTVGYGDVTSNSLFGQIWSGVIMICGIGTAMGILGMITTRLMDERKRKMKGTGWYLKKEHIVIFGWVPDKTTELINEIRADKAYEDIDIVLCADNIDENPMPSHIFFVKGKLSSHDVLERSHVVFAEKVIIYHQDDEQSVLITLAVNAINNSANIVVYIHQAEYGEHIQHISANNKNISTIVQSSVGLITQEMQDKGVADIIMNLLSNHTDKTIFKIECENKSYSFNTYLEKMEARPAKDYTLIGYESYDGKNIIFPNAGERMGHAAAIFVVAAERPEMT